MSFLHKTYRLDTKSHDNLTAVAKKLGKSNSVALRYILRRVKVDA